MSAVHRTRIKFCGNTRAEDLALAVELGVDFVGFVLVPGSARGLRAEAAATLTTALPSHVASVALFQNASADEITRALAVFSPALLQFHGREGATLCAGFGRPWIKAVPMGDAMDFAAFEREHAGAFALLADSHGTAGGGGSGHAFDWNRLPTPGHRRLPLMLAGGLTPETVGEAIRQVRPWGVDVSSGIEAGTKGVKDHRRMRAFVAAVRAADDALANQEHG